MSNIEISSKEKIYLTRSSYIQDGCPVQYFEFNRHEYYALIAVRTDLSVLEGKDRFTAKVGTEKAFDLYFEYVGGDSVEQIRGEGYPDVISESKALLKFLIAHDNQNRTVKELVKEFKSIENGVLLIDSCLL